MTINDIMTNLETKNKLENLYAKRYEKVGMWRDMHQRMTTYKNLESSGNGSDSLQTEESKFMSLDKKDESSVE